MRIILASKSPRRRQLLREVFQDFEIITRETDESFPADIHPRDGVVILAERKGRSVADEVGEDALVISSDTLVELSGTPLGKPTDEADAERMLSELSGKSHNVHTGVAVHYRGRAYSGVDSTAVHFREISRDEILDYIASGEPMDKAGSYAIQGLGGAFVTGYTGDYDTVVGLSVRLTRELIAKALEAENR